MRIRVDLPEDQIVALKTLAEREGCSLSVLISRAVAEYVQNSSVQADDLAFGLWSERKVGALAP